MRNWDLVAGSIGWPDSKATDLAVRHLGHAACDLPVLISGDWLLRGGRGLTRAGRSIAARFGMGLSALAWAVTCVAVLHFCVSIASSFLWMIAAAVGNHNERITGKSGIKHNWVEINQRRRSKASWGVARAGSKKDRAPKTRDFSRFSLRWQI